MVGLEFGLFGFGGLGDGGWEVDWVDELAFGTVFAGALYIESAVELVFFLLLVY